jgi:hypothetical protein
MLMAHILLLAVIILAFVLAIAGFKKNNMGWGWLGFGTACITLLTLCLTEDGSGLIAKTFYTTQQRAEWIEESKIARSIKYTANRIRCPLKGEWEKWDERTKAVWANSNSDYYPWPRVPGCYTRHSIKE